MINKLASSFAFNSKKVVQKLLKCYRKTLGSCARPNSDKRKVCSGRPSSILTLENIDLQLEKIDKWLLELESNLWLFLNWKVHKGVSAMTIKKCGKHTEDYTKNCLNELLRNEEASGSMLFSWMEITLMDLTSQHDITDKARITLGQA